MNKHNWFRRTYVDVDKLVVQPIFSVHQRQNQRLLRLCTLCVENGRWSYGNLEEQNLKVLGKQSLQGYESNRRHADGVRVENLPRNHNVGPPREDSKSNERPTVWTCALQRQDHLHDNVQRHYMGEKGNNERCKYNSQTLANCAPKFSRGHWSFLGLDQKRSGAEHFFLADPTDLGTKLLNKWWWISKDAVIQYFVPPVPLREENYEAKKKERSLYTSTVAMKTSSCFSARWFLGISSVSTEP